MREIDLWLVAEDSEDDFYLLQRACSRLGPAPKLQRTTNGIEAQQYLAGEGRFNNREAYPLPSMVVADLKMPVMDGLDLLAWFQRQSWQQRMPFVILTASSDQSDRDRARANGVDEFLTKPATFGDLVKTISHLSDRHSLSTTARSLTV